MENWGRGPWGRGLGRKEGEGEEAEGGPLRRRARGLPAGKGRARAAAREGPRPGRTGRLSGGAGEEGRGSRRAWMPVPERPPPPRGRGRLNRREAGLQFLQLDFPL